MNIPTPAPSPAPSRVIRQRCLVCRWIIHKPAHDGICHFCKDERSRGEKPNHYWRWTNDEVTS